MTKQEKLETLKMLLDFKFNLYSKINDPKIENILNRNIRSIEKIIERIKVD